MRADRAFSVILLGMVAVAEMGLAALVGTWGMLEAGSLIVGVVALGLLGGHVLARWADGWRDDPPSLYGQVAAGRGNPTQVRR